MTALPIVIVGVFLLTTNIPGSMQSSDNEQVPCPLTPKDCEFGVDLEDCKCNEGPHDENPSDTQEHPGYLPDTPSKTAHNCIQSGITCLQETKTCLQYGCTDCIVKALSCTLQSMQCMTTILNHHETVCYKPVRSKRHVIRYNHVCIRHGDGRRCRRGSCSCRNGIRIGRRCRCPSCCKRFGVRICRHRCHLVPAGTGNCRCTRRRCTCFDRHHRH
ncbi:uncharacterized protein LOC143033466 [Oratosquilla oratoria]|uniref:uncharacterized protein LOC143033466 n=1 Tax=Oratosquilla oratoria TaxID=337810 RepID=UPI003F77344E